jgi:hypothetical protein
MTGHLHNATTEVACSVAQRQSGSEKDVSQKHPAFRHAPVKAIETVGGTKGKGICSTEEGKGQLGLRDEAPGTFKRNCRRSIRS